MYKTKCADWLRLLVGSVLLVAVFAAVLPKVSAQAPGPDQTTACGVNTLTLTALYQAQPDVYDVYVRMGKRDQIAKAALYYQAFISTDCTKIGHAKITGKAWTKVGRLKANSRTNFGTFTLASAQIQDLPTANRPTVLLVSHRHPVCVPTTECYVRVDRQKGILHAAGTLLNEDTLHVVTAKSPKTDTITRVDYYIDNKLLYSKQTLEPFDLRYVDGDKHNLATVITYASKQQVIIPRSLQEGNTDTLKYLLFIFFNQQKILVSVVGALLGLLILLRLFLAVARLVHNRHEWLKAHFPSRYTEPQVTPLQSTQLHFTHPNSRFVRTFRLASKGVFILVPIMLVIVVINSWFLQVYQVDGHSMDSTLADGQQLMVNKLGKTFASLFHKKFIPKRGQIIIFKKAQNVLFEPTTTEGPTYVVKRVVGLPGERVVVSKGHLIVHNKAQPKGFDVDSNKSWAPQLHFDKFGHIDIRLQPDEIFVVGDNRPDSIDSRTYGAVKVDEIIGDVVARLWPLSRY